MGVDSGKQFTTHRKNDFFCCLREGTSEQTPPTQIDSDTFFKQIPSDDTIRFPPKIDVN